jgi:hypothetical protein
VVAAGAGFVGGVAGAAVGVALLDAGASVDGAGAVCAKAVAETPSPQIKAAYEATGPYRDKENRPGILRVRNRYPH